MTTVQPEASNPTAVFFWARCGGGHKTASEGLREQKKKEFAAQGKTLDVAHYDITGEKILNSISIPFFGGLGDMGVASWDNAQKRGDLGHLERFASWGWVGEILMYPIVYYKTKWLLQDLKVEPQFVCSTQAFCLNAIMHAMQAVNREKQWKMHMHVYLTDMPSKRAIHFFPSIKKITSNDSLREMITLHASRPLKKPEKEQDDAAFWEKYCGKIKVITDEDFPIRQAFLDRDKLNATLSQPTVPISIKLKNETELDIIRTGLSQEALKTSVFDENQVTMNVRDKDKLALLMLGSQPTNQSVLDWLNTFVTTGQKDKVGNTNQEYFFMYCGAPHANGNRNDLLDAVQKRLQEVQDSGLMPSHLSIIPFTNQEAESIALMMARSDVSITRSGGATAMELLQLHTSDIPKRENKLTLLNSELPEHGIRSSYFNEIGEFFKKTLRYIAREKERTVEDIQEEKVLQQLEKMLKKKKYQEIDPSILRQLALENVLMREGMILWERGNAQYLQNTIGAHVVNSSCAQSLLEKNFFS